MLTINNQTKMCSHCKKIKPLSDFVKNKTMKDGYSNQCKICTSEWRINHRLEKILYMKKYMQLKKEHIQQYQKQYRDKNKEKRRNYNLKYRNSLAKYNLFESKIQGIEEIRHDPQNYDLLQVRCKYCGKWFNPTYSQMNMRLKAINGELRISNLYCSNSCKKSCPVFGKQKYPKGYEPVTSREVQPELRKLVLERDNWTCQKCGKCKNNYPELELHCHHIFPLNEDPIRSADMGNCITLCKECHQKIHKEIAGCKYSELKCSQYK